MINGVTASSIKTVSKAQLMVPFGAGLRIDLTPQCALTFEGSSQIPFTDYLDGISFAGTPGNNDWYIFYGMSLCFKLKK